MRHFSFQAIGISKDNWLRFANGENFTRLTRFDAEPQKPIRACCRHPRRLVELRLKAKKWNALSNALSALVDGCRSLGRFPAPIVWARLRPGFVELGLKVKK